MLFLLSKIILGYSNVKQFISLAILLNIKYLLVEIEERKLNIPYHFSQDVYFFTNLSS